MVFKYSFLTLVLSNILEEYTRKLNVAMNNRSALLQEKISEYSLSQVAIPQITIDMLNLTHEEAKLFGTSFEWAKQCGLNQGTPDTIVNLDVKSFASQRIMLNPDVLRQV